jgi:hypothetical protein
MVKFNSPNLVIRDQSVDACKALVDSIGGDKCLPIIVNTDVP